MAFYLLDNSLKIEICYDEIDCEYEDNICVTITEDCPKEEKLFLADETNIFLSPEEALELAKMLEAAARVSQKAANPDRQQG